MSHETGRHSPLLGRDRIMQRTVVRCDAKRECPRYAPNVEGSGRGAAGRRGVRPRPAQ
jgi:hypothetical protein